MSQDKSAQLRLDVMDDAGRPSPFRAELIRDGRVVERIWSNTGQGVIDTQPGPASVLVRRGIDHDAVSVDLDLPAGTTDRPVRLRRRLDVRSMGWHCGEAHMHVQHSKTDPPRTFRDGARMAAGDGLDYVLLAPAWDETFKWLEVQELERRCLDASTADVVVGWNLESPKSYMSHDDGGRSGNLHCFGHGWTISLMDLSAGPGLFTGGPAFGAIHEVHRQGGVVGCAHPVRSTFGHGGNFISNWASELPFDFVAGAAYDAIDVLNDSPLLFFQSERLWYALLNMGYRVAATGNTDGALGATSAVGRFRTYAKIDGEFSWATLADAIRAGRTVATSGPLAMFEVDGRDVGSELPADGRPRRATIRAWSGPLPGETILAIQLVRNGEIIRAWDLRDENAREWATSFDVAEEEFAWYSVRVVSPSRDVPSLSLWGPHAYELAATSAVYFLPDGFRRPQPAQARLRLQVTDDAGRAIAAEAAVTDAGRLVATHRVPPEGAELVVPATASLVISADGFAPQQRTVFLDCPSLFDYSRNIGTVWPSFYSPETYDELRRRLGCLAMSVTLRSEG